MHFYSQFPLEQTEAWRRWGVTQPVCRRAEIHTDALLVPEGSMQITPCPVLPWRQHLVGITLCTHRGKDSPCLIYSWETDTWERRNTNPCHLDIRQLDRDLKLNSDSRYCESSKALQLSCLMPLPHVPWVSWLQATKSVTSLHRLTFLFLFSLAALVDRGCLHVWKGSSSLGSLSQVCSRTHGEQEGPWQPEAIEREKEKILSHRDSCPPCPLLPG